ncbi:hypothetical protein H0H87_001307, partial [Tephrocybe sp. NHM501043]
TCGSEPSKEVVAALEKHFLENKVTGSDRESNIAKTYNLNVYWHIISANNTPVGGDIPDSRIASQIAVMNKDYESTGIKWSLSRTTRTINPFWYNNMTAGSPQQTEMKNALRMGRAADLNVYSVGTLKSPKGEDLLGYATFPASYAGNPRDDGVVIIQSSLPGGAPPYDLGRTLTHEAGHWVGLYHTFQGGCNAPGDSVDDTPFEASPASGCPTGRDTCPGGGVDPIHNFMDYSDDACLDNFTPGQSRRAQDQLDTYRIGH